MACELDERRDRQFWRSLFSIINDYFTKSYPVLRPTDSVRIRIPLATRSCRSRRAVSGEHLFILAHLEEVNLPSNPSHRMLTILVWRSFMATLRWRSQNVALFGVRSMISIATLIATPSFRETIGGNNRELLIVVYDDFGVASDRA